MRLRLLCAALAVLLSSPASSVSAQGCSYTFRGASISFDVCTDLDATNKIAWIRLPSSGDPSAPTHTVYFQGVPEAAYGWAGWAVSSTGQMAGSDAIVGYGNQADEAASRVRPYKLEGASVSGVKPDQSFGLMTAAASAMAIEVANSGQLIKTLANVTIPTGGSTNVIWRTGPGLLDAAAGTLRPHSDFSSANIKLDFFAGSVGSLDTTTSNLQQKTAHAFLAGIGYGVLLPLGALVARHLKLWADPAWYYAHMTLQILGYLLGAAGWALGVWLKTAFGDMSLASQTQFSHYAIGMTIFCTSTLQILTPVIKPDKAAPNRLYWNVAHWALGYSTLILSFVQIFLGFAILRSENVSSSYGWQTAYIVFLSIWAAAFVLLEPVSWYKYRQAKVQEDERLKESDERSEGAV